MWPGIGITQISQLWLIKQLRYDIKPTQMAENYGTEANTGLTTSSTCMQNSVTNSLAKFLASKNVQLSQED